MKYKQRGNSDVDTPGRADEIMRHSGKMNGDASSIDSSSYDTTENMSMTTDTDNSSAQIKSYSPVTRRMSSSEMTRKHIHHAGGGGPHSRNNSDIEPDDEGLRLRFALNAIMLYEVESHNNFSAKERSKYWWSDREKDRMMAKHERLVAKYEQQKSGARSVSSKKNGSKSGQSYRGLESWTAAGSLKLDHTIEQCITAVMDEQDRQWNENADDSESISRRSLAVTEDSARRARLNGLQDAQEALKVRSETWGKVGSDEMSVGSVMSTGTVALVKKKKRSKLLARLDDSAAKPRKKTPSSGSGSEDDTNKTLNKEKKKTNKKKKKTSKKKEEDQVSSVRRKKKSSKEKTGSLKKSTPVIYEHVAKHQPKESLDVVNDYASVATPLPTSGLVSSFLAGPEIPVSPLSTHIYPGPVSGTKSTECPLLATLRRQQELLRQESLGLHNDRNFTTAKSINHLRQYQEEDENESTEDSSPLLQTLRRQQKKQAAAQQRATPEDPSVGGNSGINSFGSGAFQKGSSTQDYSSKGGDSESADSFDPPGRRPRRLVSRHVEARGTRSIPEEAITSKVHKNTTHDNKESKNRRIGSKSMERRGSLERSRAVKSGSSMAPSSTSTNTAATATSTLPSRHLNETSNCGKNLISAGKKGLSRLRLRNGAKTLFKKASSKKI